MQAAGGGSRVATVLIVDDNEDICRVLARLVRASGHAADVAHGGQEAVEYLADHRPDMVILDIMMPRVDGLDVLRTVRADPRTAGVPVVMFSAAGDGKLRDRALMQGANEYWVKGSLDLSELDKQLHAYLNKPN
jgi:DNA-binding response OmpR family regulator